MSMFTWIRELYEDPDAYAEPVYGRLGVKEFAKDNRTSEARLEMLIRTIHRVCRNSYPKDIIVDYELGTATGKFSPRDWDALESELGISGKRGARSSLSLWPWSFVDRISEITSTYKLDVPPVYDSKILPLPKPERYKWF